ncbi:hypothetical protein Tco_0655530, partial [Tanacetum coccineum]
INLLLLVKLMLPGITYYCWATTGSVNAVRLNLVLLVQVNAVEGEGSEIPTDSHHTPTTTQPSTSKPQKKQSRRKQRKDTEDPQLSGPTEPVTDDTKNVASVPTHSNDPLLSGLRSWKRKEGDELTGLEDYTRLVDLQEWFPLKMKFYDTKGRYGDNLMFDTGVLDNEQDMAEKSLDYELAARLKAEEQGELTIEEKSRLFVELMNKRKKHFARLRAEKKITN